MIIGWINEAVRSGARRRLACAELGLDPRTVQRWRAVGIGDDQRHGPKTVPKNKLSKAERKKVVDVCNSPEFRDLSPKQIVPTLADRGTYIASEKTFYRILAEESLLEHRGRAKPPTSTPPDECCAMGPLEVWSWDITYLRTQTRGQFFYLYLFLDVWSRKIVGWTVETEECGNKATVAFSEALAAEGTDGSRLTVHQDNGGPMKSATMKATLERLGVIASYSRPHVSDDNPFSESLFRTLKYCPAYPKDGFATIGAAREWVAAFVVWYNTVHLHSGIGYITPSDRHDGGAEPIMKQRRKVYQAARRRHPERWGSRDTRTWESPDRVRLNPDKLEGFVAETEAA